MTPKITLCLGHPDEVSGMFIMEDGTKIYWTEGRSSTMDVIDPNGKLQEVPTWIPCEINEAIDLAYEHEFPGRQMTKAEEKEWEMVRNREL